MISIVKNKFFLILLLLVAGAVTVFSQQKFRISEFALDAFDMAARNDQYKKVDGSGSLYAIIKVSGEEGDNLREYQFNFGNMNHLIEEHDGQLWVYVQKNAKQVTITRNGYTPLRNYDLRTTIEAGKTYRMHLSTQGPVIYTQMVMFQVKPADARATIMIRKETDGAQEEVFGITDAEGSVAKTREYGTYTYRVMAENYHNTEGRFTLGNRAETHIENVTLRRNGANITLTVASNADIYVNDEKKGTRTWTGLLKSGSYQVECRQANHKPSFQTVSVVEDKDATVTLTPPTPITGTVAVNSTPLRATIKIDGKDYGTTPKMISDVLIGKHTLTLSREGYEDAQSTIDIAEQQTTDVNLTLKEKTKVAAETPAVGGAPVGMDDKTFAVKGVTFVMKPVEGGTFQMGATSEQGAFPKDDEKPVHSVTLNSYYIGQTEVTQELWQAVMGSNPSWIQGSNLPVEQVSWEDCQTFITMLNQLTGQKFRLPTEAEWEYAARGGKYSKGYMYSGSNTLGSVAWNVENSSIRTYPVATKRPNELGIYDMSGNVKELCQDWYGGYSSSSQSNPTGPTSGSYRVSRGGSRGDWGSCCRVSYRCSSAPSERHYNLGLRLALSEDTQSTIGIAEQQTTDVNLTLKEKAKVVAQTIGGTSVGKDDKTFTVKGVTFVMKPVEGGTFQMGATPEQGNDAEDEEKPVHSVTLSSYYIGQTEVTQALWRAVMGRNPSKNKGDNLPVEKVSWEDCQKFIKKLNKLTGQRFRLPTEAEWEYATRGGRNSKGYKYSGSDILDEVAWCDKNSGGKTHPVATKQANELGLYDMSGNVWEWCQDWYGENYYKKSPSNNPTGPTSGYIRVNRGGGWFILGWDCRVSNRRGFTPPNREVDLGLRLALSE